MGLLLIFYRESFLGRIVSLYLLWIHSLTWLEQFKQKFWKFWREIYIFLAMTSSVTLTTHNCKSPDLPSFKVKNDQYQMIFRMRCRSALFVDIDFWPYGKIRANQVHSNPLIWEDISQLSIMVWPTSWFEAPTTQTSIFTLS